MAGCLGRAPVRYGVTCADRPCAAQRRGDPRPHRPVCVRVREREPTHPGSSPPKTEDTLYFCLMPCLWVHTELKAREHCVTGLCRRVFISERCWGTGPQGPPGVTVGAGQTGGPPAGRAGHTRPAPRPGPQPPSRAGCRHLVSARTSGPPLGQAGGRGGHGGGSLPALAALSSRARGLPPPRPSSPLPGSRDVRGVGVRGAWDEARPPAVVSVTRPARTGERPRWGRPGPRRPS